MSAAIAPADADLPPSRADRRIPWRTRAAVWDGKRRPLPVLRVRAASVLHLHHRPHHPAPPKTTDEFADTP